MTLLALQIRQEPSRSVRESHDQSSTKSEGGAIQKTDTVPNRPSKPWQKDLEEGLDSVVSFNDDPSFTFVMDNEQSPSPPVVNGLDEETVHSTRHLKVRDFGTKSESIKSMQPFREIKEVERNIDQSVPRLRAAGTESAVRIQPRPSARDRGLKVAYSTIRSEPANIEPAGRIPSPSTRCTSESLESLDDIINGCFTLPSINKPSYSHKQSTRTRKPNPFGT